MEQKGFHRKLTAILSADVAGYSRLMQDDEAATVKTLEAYKQIISDLVKQHRGRVVDSPGDNLLTEFASVVEAVQCAVATQKELQARNTELPENRKMQFRIGVNLGDVIEEESRIYGDGVNIAARLESLADPGGICVSKTAFDQIETKLPFGYEYLGEQTVKNIAKPVGAYRVVLEPRVTVVGIEEKKALSGQRRISLAIAVIVMLLVAVLALWQFVLKPSTPPVEKADPEKMAFPLPEKPSIAVLPFANISDDPKQEYFCDGLTEEIITAVSKSPNLFVIARNTAFIYKGKPVKIKQVSEDLGVRYVLEGSVRREGERVRITAQFIDAMSGHHLWSERFDRDLKGILTLQEEIALKITKALHVRLPGGDRGGSTGKGTKNVEAYLKVMEGAQLVFRYTKEDNAVAHKLLEEAIALDPDYARAYSVLGLCFLQDVVLGTSKSPKQELERAIEMGQKSLALDESDAHANSILAVLYARTRQFDKAVAQAERALALDPNSFSVLNNSGSALMMGGKPDQAIPLLEKAIRLDPFASAVPYAQLSHAYRMVNRYEDALASAKKAVERNPRFLPTQLGLAFGCVLTGHDEEARAAAAEILKINPKFCIEEWTKTLPFKDQSYIDRFADALLKVGLPDKPPLSLPDKPSIAVLPFVNMSADPEQEYFSDGISEDIITDLSKISGLIVIARNSSFSYKGKPVNVQQIGQDLGVRYLLEGSVRKAGDQMRINAQLIDASNGRHLWAERYDGKFDDVFALQDKITRKIISALALKLTAREQKAVADKGTDNLQAYDEFLKGWQGYRQLNKEGFAEAKIHLEKAVELDPDFARAYAALAILYWKAVQTAAPGLRQGLGVTNRAELDAVRMKPHLLLKKAMKKPTALAHGLMSQFYLFRYMHDEALAEIERAIAMDPNDPDLYTWMSNILWFMGKNSEAIESAKMGQRLDPNNPAAYLNQLGKVYFPDGNLQESLQLLEKAKRLNPDLSGSVAFHQAIIYGIQGRNEEARTAYEIFLKNRMTPVRSLKDLMSYYPFADPKKRDSFAAVLIKAGVPGNPTDYHRLLKENRISGQEVKSLLFGRKITGTSMSTGEQLWFEWAKNGEFKFIMGSYQDSGKSWVEGDVCFFQFEKLFGGLPYGAAIFRNPDGSRESKNEYFMVSDSRAINPFALTE